MIKRVLCLFAILILLIFSFLFLSKFFFKNKKINPNFLVSEFKANALIITSDKEIQCEINNNSKKTSITIENQKNINGFSFELDENNRQKIIFQGLEHEFDKKISLENSYVNISANVLKYISNSKNINLEKDPKNNEFKCREKTKNIEFELITDENGIIKEINIMNQNIKIILTAFF